MKNLTAVPVPIGTIHIDTANIPLSTAQNIAQVALRGIQKAYADPAIQEDYRRWKAERAAKEDKPHGV